MLPPFRGGRLLNTTVCTGLQSALALNQWLQLLLIEVIKATPFGSGKQHVFCPAVAAGLFCLKLGIGNTHTSTSSPVYYDAEVLGLELGSGTNLELELGIIQRWWRSRHVCAKRRFRVILFSRTSALASESQTLPVPDGPRSYMLTLEGVSPKFEPRARHLFSSICGKRRKIPHSSGERALSQVKIERNSTSMKGGRQ